MRHLAIPAVAVLALLVGCKDNPRQSPTEPTDEAAAAVVAAPQTEAEIGGESTLCAAYRVQLGDARAALARDSKNASLQETVATYEAVLADACP